MELGGLDTGLPLPPAKATKEKKTKSLPFVRTAATRRLKSLGISRPEGFRTAGANYLKFDYEIPEIEAELIDAVLVRELIGRNSILVNMIIEGEDADGEPTAAGTAFRIVTENNHELVAESEAIKLQSLAARYQVQLIEQITVTVSIGINRKEENV